MSVVKNTEIIKQMLMFLGFSITAGIIQTASFAYIYEIKGLDYWGAYISSLMISVLWNYSLNRRYTFRSAAKIPITITKVAVFYIVFLPVSTCLGNKLSLLEINAYVILIPTMLVNLILEFLYTKFYVYKDQINTAVKSD